VKTQGSVWRVAYFLAALGIYITDQLSKTWATQALRLSDERTIVKGLLDLAYAENRGIAFGQLQDGGAIARWVFVSLGAAAAVAVLVYFFRTPTTNKLVLAACTLLLAGILGNLTDRLQMGYVVDFILAHAGPYRWPTFNVADASICGGAILLAYDLFFEGKRRPEAEPAGREAGVGEPGVR
jgi:signal peptidase II